jgi:four helix bundle protein
MLNAECATMAQPVLNALDMGIAETLKARTFEFAAAVYRVCATAPETNGAGIIRIQLIKASASVAANYRAACRGRSRPEFIAKLGVAIEEADESLFWLDFAEATQAIAPSPELQKLVPKRTSSWQFLRHRRRQQSATRITLRAPSGGVERLATETPQFCIQHSAFSIS